MSLLVVMGSGETSPTMVKVHREVLAARPGEAAGPAVMLDTPFAFQMNADDLVTRTQAYFAQSVGVTVEAARWRRADADMLEREQALALLGRASWAFAGPGSPTYALRQWIGTPLPDALADVATRGGTLVFGSAAACTIGTHAIPVYEIYKVGEDPHWAPALDLLGRLTGLHTVVIPHFDNAEGGQHDTRYCYLGEQRLRRLEAELPDEIGVLGVDEHTALIIDLPSRTVRVVGNGVVTLRRRGAVRTFPSGESLDLDALDALLSGRTPLSSPAPAGDGADGADGADSTLAPDRDDSGVVGPAGAAVGGKDRAPAARAVLPSLRRDADEARARFEEAIAARDAEGCVSAILELEEAIVGWRSDTDENDDEAHARQVLRSMIVRLGELARDGVRDPRQVVGPFVEALLEVRGRARAAKDYATSDLLRDRLAASGVEVRDTPDGATWAFTGQ